MRQLGILCIEEERKSSFEVESLKRRQVTRAPMLKHERDLAGPGVYLLATEPDV